MAKGTRGSLAGPPGGGELRPRLSAKWRRDEETWAGLAVLDRGGRVRGDSRRPERPWRNELSPGLKQTKLKVGGGRKLRRTVKELETRRGGWGRGRGSLWSVRVTRELMVDEKPRGVGSDR